MPNSEHNLQHLAESLQLSFDKWLSNLRRTWHESVLHDIPDLHKLESSVIVCHQCKSDISYEELPPLAMIRCPNCDELTYTPMKIKDYWLFAPLGSGGQGSVWKAFSLADSRLYAIKIIAKQYAQNQHMLDIFLREANAGMTIPSHPNIVKTIDSGKIGDVAFIVSELLPDAERLDSFISARRPIPSHAALQIIDQVIVADMHILAHGYLFRDIKPENIFITSSAQVKIIDFGLCIPSAIAAGDYNAHTVEGSPLYMPPERINRQPESESSEIYSIGMVLFHLLSGHSFITADKSEKALHLHTEGIRLPTSATQLTQCDKIIVEVVDKMAQRDPAKRYHTLAKAHKDIQILLHQPFINTTSSLSQLIATQKIKVVHNL